MNIASICQRRVITIEADASLKETAASMRENHVGALVVIDAVEASRVAGVVTDRDLAIEVLAGDVDAARMRIGGLARALRSGIARESAERGPLPPSDPVFLPIGMPGMH